MPRSIRDDDGGWPNATPGQRLLGLAISVAMTLVLLSPVFVLVDFLVLR